MSMRGFGIAIAVIIVVALGFRGLAGLDPGPDGVRQGFDRGAGGL